MLKLSRTVYDLTFCVTSSGVGSRLEQRGENMNLIARIMKRYIKMPLKYVLPLLFIGSLALVSISGRTSQINNQLNATTSVSTYT